MDSQISTTLPPARIMIVDDHPNTAAMLARVLGKFESPVEVLTACSGEEAVELIGDSLIDILITDFMMAGMNGLDLIEKLRGERQPSHTILITAYDTPGLKISAKQLKVNDYLVKPVQPEKIREIVGRVLKEIRPQFSQNIAVQQQRVSKILVSDDNPDNIRLLTVRLKSEGYDYITAEDGIETLEKIRTEKPDLVLLDVNMPKKDGFEVLLEMRADEDIAHVPVIVVTAARIAAKDVREGLTLGADDYVTKPVDWRELSARIRTKLRVKQAEDALRSRAKELGVLPELSKDLGERLDVEELTRTILARSIGALSATNGFLLIFYPDGSTSYQMFRQLDYSPSTMEEFQKHLVSEGAVQQAINQREGIILNHCQQRDEWIHPQNDTTQSAMVFPLLGRRDVLGVLALTHELPDFFKPEHANLVQAIASQAAIAIENAQLYTIERKRVNELVALNQLTHQISKFTHSNELFEDLPEMVRNHLGYPSVALWEKQEDRLKLRKISGEENAPRRSLLEISPIQAAQTGQPVSFSGPIEERTGDRMGTGKPPVISVIAVPIIWNGKVNGVLSIQSLRPSIFQESDRVLLETLASQIGIVSERIGLFESIEQEQKRLAAVLRAAADAILVLNNNNELQIINPAGEKLFTDVTTKIGSPLPANRGYDGLISVLNRASQSRNQERTEIRWPDARTFSVLVAPVAEGGQVAVLHDVSHFMAINQLKNEFIATATHDLKNPIFAVLGYSDLLSKAGTLNEMQTDFVRRIRGSAMQMQDLVLNLLDMARIEMETDLKKGEVDLAVLLQEVCDEFTAQAQAKNHEMAIDIHDAPLWVMGDRMRLQQVARNLLGNAIKYTPSGGKIFVTSTKEAGMVKVCIRDSGIGIPEESIPHIFEKFYRVHTDATQDIEGNGLGLAIVKSIVEQHGGTIHVESKEGQGSCFSFMVKSTVGKK
jgi:signal transduction histidine kinase/DNA-binding response OmpR family regulator